MIPQKYIDNLKENYDGKFVGDARHKFAVGDVGFLLELTPATGSPRLELRDSPARTQDWTDILFGLGVAKVTEVARNGRGKVLTLWGPDAEAALNDLGYPEIRRDEYTVEQGFVSGS
jgi:hypothetical protein